VRLALAQAFIQRQAAQPGARRMAISDPPGRQAWPTSDVIDAMLPSSSQSQSDLQSDCIASANAAGLLPGSQLVIQHGGSGRQASPRLRLQKCAATPNRQETSVGAVAVLLHEIQWHGAHAIQPTCAMLSDFEIARPLHQDALMP